MGKRDDILAATLDLISEEGLQSATFSKIFKRANVGSGTVYHYFRSKEELVGALYTQTVGQFSDALLEDYDASGSVFSCFKQLLTNMACFAYSRQKELWFLENYAHSPYIAAEIRECEVPAMTECLRLIRRGAEQGLLRDVNPLMCVQMVSGMVTRAIQGSLLCKYPMDEAVFDQVIEICWRAFVI